MKVNRRSKAAHVCAWMLACATFPLIWVGGLVTTTDAGMAFRDWLTSDGYFMPFYPWLSSAGDKFVEHGHRLLGMTAGVLSIALVIITWRTEPRRWVRRFSLVILVAVVLQGLLGGMRVVLDERTLALIHGCTGPLFFALCTAMVVFTSRWWQTAQTPSDNLASHKIFRLALICTCLAYAQLVIGAIVRHSPHMIAATAPTIFQLAVYFHLLLALLIVVHVSLLAWSCGRSRHGVAGGVCLFVLIGIQLFLGASTWAFKYGMPMWATTLLGEMTFVNKEGDLVQASIITSHVAVGSLIFVTALVIALRNHRQLGATIPRLSTPHSRLMGAML